MTRAFALLLLIVLAATGAPASGSAGQRAGGRPGDEAVISVGVIQDGAPTVIALPLETYVARVLAGEAAPGSRPAALEALAIAIRTYAAANLGRHRADGFDLCDQTHCQVLRTANPQGESAAVATAGQVLLDRGVPASIYYSASCGGRTEIPSAVWPGATDSTYLPSRPDAACEGRPEWSVTLARADLQRALEAAGYRGTLRNVRVASRHRSGRVATLRLDGVTPPQISGQDLRVVVGRTLGWQQVKSAAFDVDRERDGFRFSGRGYGHGVGMCVFGSIELAVRGESARAILSRYFPGLTIGPSQWPVGTPAPVVVTEAVAPRPKEKAPARPRAVVPAAPARARAEAVGSIPLSGVAITMTEVAPGERAELTSLMLRYRDDLSARLAVRPPPVVAVSVHDSTSDYQRATGRAWFTSGAVVRGEIHLPPVDLLRKRGVFDRSLRQQLVQVLTGPEQQGRPAWIREGTALVFSEDTEPRARTTRSKPAALTSPGPKAGRCPTDQDLLSPASPGSLSASLAEARACVERSLASGKTWRTIK